MLRFDTTIAVCALLLSAIAASAAVYQTRVIAEENSAAVWQYISFPFRERRFRCSMPEVRTFSGASPRTKSAFASGMLLHVA